MKGKVNDNKLELTLKELDILVDSMDSELQEYKKVLLEIKTKMNTIESYMKRQKH
jgi:hypothetical protein